MVIKKRKHKIWRRFKKRDILQNKCFKSNILCVRNGKRIISIEVQCEISQLFKCVNLNESNVQLSLLLYSFVRWQNCEIAKAKFQYLPQLPHEELLKLSLSLDKPIGLLPSQGPLLTLQVLAGKALQVRESHRASL